MAKFRQLINPHSHSDGSLDGAASVKQIVKRNKELGATHVTITDHGNFNTAMELYNTCIKEGVKPILGVELYLESPFKDELRKIFEAESKEEDPVKREKKIQTKLDSAYVHMTVHFKTEKAYKYFCSLSPQMDERATTRWGERKPVITLEELRGASGEITICSSCLVGGAMKWILPNFNRPDLAEQFYLTMREIAGPENFFVEVFPHEVTHDWVRPEYDKVTKRQTKPGYFKPHECSPLLPDGDLQKIANQFILKMAKKYGDRPIISLDSHFAVPEQKVIQDAKLGNGQENWVFHNSYYIMSTEEAAESLKKTLGVTDEEIAQWVDNSYQWASLFNDFKLKTSKDRWVLEPVPDNYMQRVKAAIDRYGRMDWSNQAMLDRLKFEMQILAGNGTFNLMSYFFTIEEMANYCKDNGILMNVRGSAGGSLLLYLLGISGVNPLEYNLSFARFITLGRIKANTPPDVDMDISTGGRDQLIAHLEEKYGDRFCRISTDSLLKLKSSIKDAERAINGIVERSTEDLCRSLPNEGQGIDSREFVFGSTDADGTHTPGLIDHHPALKAYAENNPKIWNTVKEMLGIQRQKSIHACGVCIADEPIQHYCPVIRVSKTKATGFSPKSVEAAGLLKYDLLGLNTLRDIQLCLESIEKRTGQKLDPWNLPFDHNTVVEFAKGNVATVFQFDTPTIRPYVRKITKPSEINSLIDFVELMAAITSLGRPGTLDAPSGDGRTLAEVYVARCDGETTQYIHDDLESVLGKTRGIALYQEQTIEFFKKLAGYTDEQAETVRRGIGKKDKKVLESCMADLRAACLQRGWTGQQVDLLIEQIMASARYSFNKSHAVSYAKVAYACLYLKTNYPLDWWKAALSNADKTELVAKFWSHVHSFTTLPDINKSGELYEIVGDQLVAPISIMSGIGPKAYQQLVAGKPYVDIRDFVKKHFAKGRETRSAVNSGIVRKLIAAGTLDSLFDPGMERTTDKLSLFEQIKAEVKGGKPEKVPEEYWGMTTLGSYLVKKELISVFSQDITELVLKPRGGQKDSYGRWRIPAGADGQTTIPIMTADEIQIARERAEHGMGVTMNLACVAYVSDEKTKQYKNKTKQMTQLFVDVNGHFGEEILWPPYRENIAASGFKGLPVILIYRSQQNRFGLDRVVRLLKPDEVGRYNVL